MNFIAIKYGIRMGGTSILILILLLLYAMLFFLKPEHRVPKPLQKYLMYEELPINELFDIEKLKDKIKKSNANLEVRNNKQFGIMRAHTTILAVQVHQDVARLQHLIISLAQVRYINSVLLIFSHSYYNEKMNLLIRSIDFCKVVQIFYPHSLQLHPNKFPGVDPEDCVNGTRTTNFTFCQERDAKMTEHKQHWWWKANFIFEHMPWSRSYYGTVIFLEEYHYVIPDLLYILQFAQRSLSYFPQVEVMSFGRMLAKHMETHLLTLEYWRPPFDVGLAFNKTTWKKILSFSSFYCMYDDCSWSYSLLNLFKNFPTGSVNMVACVTSRVVSTKQFISMDRALTELYRAFPDMRLYPEKVEVVSVFGPEGRVERKVRAPPVGNGGWNDIRDQLLCLDPLITTTEDYYETTPYRD